MKDSCIKIFSFLPSDYDSIENYLEEKLKEGYRLKWIKGGFAGFVKNESDNIRYVVEPYPNTNFITFKRLPKIRLDQYTENNWYFVGKTRGNYIFFTDKAHAEYPNLEPNSKEKIISAETKRNGALLVLLIFIAYQCLSSKAFMYSYVLMNIYIYLSVILAFLGIISIASIFMYALETVRMQNKTLDTSGKGGISRGRLYTVRNIGVIALAFLFFIYETKSTPEIMLLLLIPVAIMIIAALVLKSIAEKGGENASKKITNTAFLFGAVITVFIIVSLFTMQKINTASAQKDFERSLQKAETLPVLHYSDFFDGEYSSLSRENNSLMGENYLFSEADKDGNNVFTNYTVAKNDFAAEKVFDYLYTQGQADYKGEFVPVENSLPEGVEAYTIEGKYAFMIRNGREIILMTAGEAADKADVDKKVEEIIASISE